MHYDVKTSHDGGKNIAPVCLSRQITSVQKSGTLTFPIARSALSKNKIIPKKRKNTPKPVNPIPISVGDTQSIYFSFR